MRRPPPKGPLDRQRTHRCLRRGYQRRAQERAENERRAPGSAMSWNSDLARAAGSLPSAGSPTGFSRCEVAGNSPRTMSEYIERNLRPFAFPPRTSVSIESEVL